MAGYEFGFLLEQSLGGVTHTKNLLTNSPLIPRCTRIGDWSILKPRELPERSLFTRATGRCGQVCARAVRLPA